MARAPFQCLVLLYKIIDGAPVFAVFHRSDWDIWQFVSGGGEDEESPLEAAKRELREETGITDVRLCQLDSRATISASIYAEEHRQRWGPKQYVVMEYAFACELTDQEIRLSSEHTEYRWMDLEEAVQYLKFDSNRTAAIETVERWKNKDLPMSG